MPCPYNPRRRAQGPFSSAMEVQAAPGMPQWMVAAAGDPKHGAEAQRLWQEHQAFSRVVLIS